MQEADQKLYIEPHEIMLWFDLDDTLWDMTGNSAICLREMYFSQNLDRLFATPEEWDRIYHEINAVLWDKYGRGEITREFLREERFAQPLRLAGVASDRAQTLSHDFDRIYLDLLGRQTTLVDGARDLLAYLRDKGYRMGIVSNGFREVQYNKLKSSRIDSYFDPVVLSDDAGHNKPDRRFFEYALQRASSRKMLNVVIGDNLNVDIVGAVDAGLRAVWFRRERDRSTEADICTVDSLLQLKNLF